MLIFQGVPHKINENWRVFWPLTAGSTASTHQQTVFQQQIIRQTKI